MNKGLIYNKESFLSRIAKNLDREVQKTSVTYPSWRYEPQREVYKNLNLDELTEVLKLQCKSNHIKAVESNMGDLSDTIESLLLQMNASSVVCWNDSRFTKFGLDVYLQKAKQEGMDIHTWDPSLGSENILIAEKADVGITFSDITLAESATVVLFSDEGKGRSVSLLPTSYLAIVPKSTIVPRLTQATEDIHRMQKERGKVPSCINFISGPSNSADIEMNLVIGVHGPIKAYYVIVDDIVNLPAL